MKFFSAIKKVLDFLRKARKVQAILGIVIEVAELVDKRLKEEGFFQDDQTKTEESK